MAEETYGIQESVKSGDDMLNIRGADADEFLAVYQGLLDAAEDNDVAQILVDKYGLGKKAKKSSSSSSSSSRRSSGGGSRRSSGDDDEPSQKQLDFAKQLKIRGYSKMSKKEISAAIDEALAAREDDDDDED